MCENCEESPAEFYCRQCSGLNGTPGVFLCENCIDQIHRGVLNKGHICQPISEAPRPPRNPAGKKILSSQSVDCGSYKLYLCVCVSFLLLRLISRLLWVYKLYLCVCVSFLLLRLISRLLWVDCVYVCLSRFYGLYLAYYGSNFDQTW